MRKGEAEGVMMKAPESIPLGNCSQSEDHLTPRTESTVFSLARSEFKWTTEPARSSWEFYRHAILLMATGGSVLLTGLVVSGLHFTKTFPTANIVGPALLSVGLMALVVGVVLIPVTKELKQQHSMKRLYSYYKPPILNL
ncbi:phosphoinositide-interacting protein [Denticeps clupeoides]|uniref:Uncharacterized protein n=1 Tax=Denticeps clupeoides TaxID=299321 RepID=A0AAY4C0N7_9TELE|nr:phosphoinositide-interacting protein [Denticeps clupeoides]